MAKIILGGNIGAISGSLGADTYSKNHYGYYIRKWSEPTGDPSDSQLLNRSIFADISFRWKDLSQDQRNAWEQMTYSFSSKDIFGQNIRLTGQILFIKLNCNLLSIGLPFCFDPQPFKAWKNVDFLKTFNVVMDTVSGLLNFYPTSTGIDVIYKIFATPSVSPGISKPYNMWRYIGIIGENQNSPFDFFNLYTEVFGIPNKDLKVFIKLTPICTITGFRGVDIINNTIVLP